MPSLMATLGLDSKPFEMGLEHARHHAQSEGAEIYRTLGSKVGGALGFFESPGAQVNKGFEMIAQVFERNMEMAEKAKGIAVGAEQLGISAERFQDLSRAAIEAGTDIGAVEAAYKNLAKAAIAAEAGDAKATAALKTFGITADEVKNKSVDEIFDRVMVKSKGAEFNVEQVGAVMALFGKTGNQMLAGMKRGAFLEANPFGAGNEEIEHKERFADDVKLFKDAASRAKDVLTSFGTGGLVQSVTHGLANRLRGALGMNVEGEKAGAVDLKTVTKAEVQQDRKDTKEAQKEARELANLNEQTARDERAAAREKMTAAEKILDTQREINRLEEDRTSAMLLGDPVLAAETELAIAKEKKQLAQEETKATTKAEQIARITKPHLNALQQAGAFVSPAELAMAGVAQASKQHLAKIEKHLAAIEKLSANTKY